VASLRRHPIYKDALICQLVALLLTTMIDGIENFAPLVLAGWIGFWIGLVFFVRFRVAPTKAELFFVRFGPLFVFILVFMIGQYV